MSKREPDRVPASRHAAGCGLGHAGGAAKPTLQHQTSTHPTAVQDDSMAAMLCIYNGTCVPMLPPAALLWDCLQSRQHLAPAAADRIRALACNAVLGLARDSSIRHILTKLQVSDAALSLNADHKHFRLSIVHMLFLLLR